MRAFLAGGVLAAISTAMVFTASPGRAMPGTFHVRLMEHDYRGMSRVSHWARRADGWMAHTTSSESRELISGAGTVIIVSDKVKARSTFDRVGAGLFHFPTPESNCSQLPDGRKVSGQPGGQRQIQGQRVLMFQELQGPLVRRTTWAAPELGCLVLQAAAEDRESPEKPWRLKIYLTTEAAEAGTYPEWIFALPPDYREMSPGQVVSLLTNGQSPASDRLRDVDASYFSNPARMKDVLRPAPAQ